MFKKLFSKVKNLFSFYKEEAKQEEKQAGIKILYLSPVYVPERSKVRKRVINHKINLNVPKREKPVNLRHSYKEWKDGIKQYDKIRNLIVPF